MAAPTKITYSFDFGDFTASTPNLPLPGGDLDTQLTEIKRASDETIDRLNLVQRDDGGVANASIGTDQLKSELTGFGLTSPTSWATATSYAVNDVVFKDNAVYHCATAHTSGTFSTDLGSGYWTLLADLTAFTASDNLAWNYAFDTSTTMADPGTGEIRLNNGTVSSVTAIAISANTGNSGNPDVSDLINVWGESTATNKATLVLRKKGTPSTFAVFKVTAVTDNTGWLQLTVAHVQSSGAWSAADTVSVEASVSGDGAGLIFGTVGGETLTASKSVFTVDYEVGALEVFINGVRQTPTVDFTASNGTSFTLTTAALAGDRVDWVGWQADSALANAVLTTLTDVSSWSWILDEDDMSSDLATKVPTQQSVKAYVDNVSINNLAAVANGRLSLTTGTPVTSADVTGATTLYYTPYNGSRIAIYNTSTSLWELLSFTEKSIGTTGGTASKPHDVFGVKSAGMLALELLAWTDDTTRATGLTTQDGVYVKSGDASRRYLGTVYLDGSKQIDDSLTSRHVWNVQNRVERPFSRQEGTNSWTYNNANLRQVNSSASNQFSMVVGLNEDRVTASAVLSGYSGSAAQGMATGFGLDSTSAMASGCISQYKVTHTANYTLSVSAHFSDFVGVGKHYLAWLESGDSSTVTFLGDNGGVTYDSGIVGSIRA